jgi:isoquinoline 1-oxidoreductase subunit beta
LEFRLNLIGPDRIENTQDAIKYNTARMKHVLRQAAKNANYGKALPQGHAFGIAVQYSFYSYVASVVEVSFINNKVKVHNVYTVIDCGTVINRDTVKAQLEGAAIFGMSLTYYGKITAKDGAIEQNSFSDYPLIRMNEAPKIHVEIVESTENPTGVGEPGVPVIAPAIVNALFQLTGKKYYNLPLIDYEIVG